MHNVYKKHHQSQLNLYILKPIIQETNKQKAQTLSQNTLAKWIAERMFPKIPLDVYRVLYLN